MTQKQINSDDTRPIISLLEEAQEDIIKLMSKSDAVRNRPALLRQIRRIIESLGGDVTKTMFEMIDDEWAYSRDTVDTALKGIKFTPDDFSVVDKEVIQFILGTKASIKAETAELVQQYMSNSFTNITKTITTIQKQVKEEAREALGREVKRKIAKSAILGESIQKINKQLIEYMENEGLKALVTQNKRGNDVRYSLKATADRLTRQTLTNASASSVLNRSIERGVDLVKVSSHSDQSPMCQPYSGKILSISGKIEEYIRLDKATFSGRYVEGGGLFHPSCRHRLVPYIPTKIKFDRK